MFTANVNANVNVYDELPIELQSMINEYIEDVIEVYGRNSSAVPLELLATLSWNGNSTTGFEMKEVDKVAGHIALRINGFNKNVVVHTPKDQSAFQVITIHNGYLIDLMVVCEKTEGFVGKTRVLIQPYNHL